MMTVDTDHDRVLLVNDCGPDADAIERSLLSLIENRAGFRYERNPRNLGFVGTCNRAAFELDLSGNDLLLLNSDTVVTPGWLEELAAVLHVDPSHGVVCARSTHATIASMPFRLQDPGATRTLARSTEVLAMVGDRLPRYSYPPVAMGFCFLIRRDLIDRFGLFDEIFAPGYGEENDFCLRIGRAGFRSVMAHRALVAHEGARSFLDIRRARLRADHERILVKRHPDYPARVRDYLWCEVDPIDAFADVLVPKANAIGRLEAVLVEAGPPAARLMEIATVRRDDLGLTVLTSQRCARAWQKYVGTDRVVVFGAEEGRVWDLALCDAPPGSEAHLRAGHAAPRVAPTASLARGDIGQALVSAARTPIADAELRERWRSDAERMRCTGIPAQPRPPARQRARAILERRAPRLLAAARRTLRR